VPSSPLKWAESLNCRRWEDFTTDTNDGRLSNRVLLNIYTDPAAVILCSGKPIRHVVHNSAIRLVLSETEEFVPSRVLLTLFQRDRIFGRDNSRNELTEEEAT